MPSPDLHSYPLQTSLSIGPSGLRKRRFEGEESFYKPEKTGAKTRMQCVRVPQEYHRSHDCLYWKCSKNWEIEQLHRFHYVIWEIGLSFSVASLHHKRNQNCRSKTGIIAVLYLARHWVAATQT